MNMKNPIRKNEASMVQPGALSGALPTAFLYLVGISLGELLTSGEEPMIGLVLHGVILLMLILQGASANRRVAQRFYFSMTLVPLIRLMSLSLPLTNFLFVYWYLIIGTPLFLAAFFSARMMGLSIDRLLFNIRRPGLQIVVALSGVLLGYIEYVILRPQPLVESFTFRLIWQPALILLIFTGLLEEIIFRGLLQQSSREFIGRWGVFYAGLLFAVMHLGYRSNMDFLFVLLVALYFGQIVLRTRSILGVTIAHGLTNIGLFLVFPFLASGQYQLPGWLPMPPPITVTVAASLPSETPQLERTWTPVPSYTYAPTFTEPAPEPTLITPTITMTPTLLPATATPRPPLAPFPETLPQVEVVVPNEYLIMVDDGDPGFLRTGGTTWLSGNGVGGDLLWASPTEGEADAVVEWRPDLPADGYYEVQVFCPDGYATFPYAMYGIGGLDEPVVVLVDQSEYQGKWASLGIYAFKAGDRGFVRLDNHVVNVSGVEDVVGFDAVRWVLIAGDE
jgi:CAAX protease family protein